MATNKGPIVHLVLFQVQENAPAAAKKKMDEGIQSLTALPQVQELSFGPVITDIYPGYNDRTKGFTHALSVTLTDIPSLEAYAKHPDHVKVVQKDILPVLAPNGVLAVDIVGTPSCGPCSSSVLFYFLSGAVLGGAVVYLLRGKL